MASRRFGGGLAEQTLAVAHVLDAAGFDPVIIETVGTGQDEVEIARLALTTLLIQVPGLGDSIQTLKAGSLEIGDILVVNKADGPEAIGLIRDLHHMKALAESHPEGGWDPPVVKTSALKGEGIDNLIHAIAKHRAWLESSGELAERLRTIAGEEVAARVRSEWRRWAEGSEAGAELAAFIGRVADREVSPRQAASDILEQLTKPAR
jgi:LAO/AO transport system kinase